MSAATLSVAISRISLAFLVIAAAATIVGHRREMHARREAHLRAGPQPRAPHRR